MWEQSGHKRLPTLWNMKMAVFWDVAPYSLREVSYPHHQGLHCKYSFKILFEMYSLFLPVECTVAVVSALHIPQN
jgi:hypothetical protein